MWFENWPQFSHVSFLRGDRAVQDSHWDEVHTGELCGPIKKAGGRQLINWSIHQLLNSCPPEPLNPLTPARSSVPCCWRLSGRLRCPWQGSSGALMARTTFKSGGRYRWLVASGTILGGPALAKFSFYTFRWVNRHIMLKWSYALKVHSYPVWVYTHIFISPKL